MLKKADVVNHPKSLLDIDGALKMTGGGHRSKINRWMENYGFPDPIVIAGRRYWYLEDIIAWNDAQRDNGETLREP